MAVNAFAQYPHHNHRHGGWGYGWVAPTIIGGVIGYEIARSQQPVIVQPPVVMQSPQDIVYLNGVAYRKQLMMVNGMYQEVLVKI